MTPNEMQNKLNEAVMNIQSLQDELDKLKQADTYFPESGEVVWVSDDLETWHKRIFVKFLGFNSSPYKCVWENQSNTTRKYLLGKNYITSDWAYCRRLDGEIIPFGRDKYKDPDYSHLLPDGYEFCKDDEQDDETEIMYLKVKLHNLDPNEKPLGSIMQDAKHMEAFYRPIRKIQYHVAVHETVTTEPNSYTIEKHGDGWAIYQGRDSMHHGANLGQIHNGKLADIIRNVLNDKPDINPYAVDWSNAPEWADSHAFDNDGEGVWYGVKKGFVTWIEKSESSNFRLPSNLDWFKSKTTRP